MAFFSRMKSPELFGIATLAFGIPNGGYIYYKYKLNNQYKSDVIVIGGGIVGLSVCRELLLNKQNVTLLEKEQNLGSSAATSGNSGLGCTGYDAPKGSLERQLLRRSILLHPNLYRSFGLSYDHIQKCGSLVVAWTEDELAKLPEILKENYDIGDNEAYLVSKQELLQMEPSLNNNALGAIYVPREVIAEPWLVTMGYIQSCINNGAKIYCNNEVIDAKYNETKNNYEWKVTTSNGTVFTAPIVINCAGLYGDHIEQFRIKCDPDNVEMDDKMDVDNFKIKPRKGQFVVYKASDSSKVDLNYIIEPVPTLRTKGVIIWKSVYGNIIVGPTADEQTSKVDRSNDKSTIDMLSEYGENKINNLKEYCEIIGTYSGIRPATQYRDYQINSYPKQNWISVSGIRSTGLTASSGIGEYVGNLYMDLINKDNDNNNLDYKETDIVPPYNSLPLQHDDDVVINSTVPTLMELSNDFKLRNNGKVKIYGDEHQVTHPISYFGMKSME